MTKKLLSAACCLATLAGMLGIANAQKPLAIQGGKIITLAGDPIENGTILFRDGRIIGVGTDLKIPVEAKVIDATGKVIIPGFVEAHSSSGMSQANESNPLVPYVSVIDSIDPMNSYFRTARRNGITSVAITPGNTTMIGGQAAVIKTGGEFVDEMILKSDLGVKISLRPIRGSRMSHLAKLRKALEDAKKKLADKNKEDDEVKNDKDEKQSDSDKKKPEAAESKSKPESKEDEKKETKKEDAEKADKPDSDLDKAMFKLLSKKLTAIIYCDLAMDVGHALRLIEEYDLKATLVLGQKCYKAADEVAASGLPVILDANLVFWEEDPRTKEEKKVVVPQIFAARNVTFALQTGRSGSATLGNNYLWYQAATCIKYGMSPEDGLRTLTVVPAKFLGVDKWVGTIEKGKDGDVVILSGDPLKVDTWVEKTLVNGQIVYDRENDEQLQRLLGRETNSTATESTNR